MKKMSNALGSLEEPLTKIESNSSRRELRCHCLCEGLKGEFQRIIAVRNIEPTCHGEHFLRWSKAICLRHSDRKPNEAKEKVEHHYEDREAEDKRKGFGRKVVDCNRDDEKGFRDGPDEGAPFNIVVGDSPGKIDFPDGKLGNDVVRRCLQGRDDKQDDRMISRRRTWQLPAANVIHAVHDHQATTNPKNRAYLGPALSAAHM